VGGSALAVHSNQSPTTAPAAVYASVVNRVYGTPVQRQAADEWVWWTAQNAADECRRRVGVEHPARALVSLSDRETVAPGDLLGFAPTGAHFGVAEQLRRAVVATENAAHFARWMARSSDWTRARWVAAQHCEAVSASSLVRVPPGQAELAAALVGELARVQATVMPTLPADYRSCLRSNGLPVADLSALQVRVEQAFPAVALGARTVPGRLAGWQDAVAFEHRAAAVDARCRAAAVEALTVAAAPHLSTFAVEHAAGLNRVAGGWARIELEARELRPED
jgi:hypothetical protein